MGHLHSQTCPACRPAAVPAWDCPGGGSCAGWVPGLPVGSSEDSVPAVPGGRPERTSGVKRQVALEQLISFCARILGLLGGGRLVLMGQQVHLPLCVPGVPLGEGPFPPLSRGRGAGSAPVAVMAVLGLRDSLQLGHHPGF